MARHASPQTSTGRRALAALATAGVALGAGAGTAAAATGEPVADVVRTRPTSVGQLDPQAGVQGALGSLTYVTGALTGLKPNPSRAPASTRSTTASAPSSPTSSR